jgi:hypothetical protein
MKVNGQQRTTAEDLRAEFGSRRLIKVVSVVAFRLAALATLCLLGLGFLTG